MMPEIRRALRHILDDQAGRLNPVGFRIFVVDAAAADMRIGQRDDLTAIGGIGQDFLVTGHGGVEYHLAYCAAGGADSIAVKYGAVGERKDSGLKRREHG